MWAYLLSVVLIVVGSLSASQNYVQLADPVYPFLDRLATQGMIPGFLNDTKPLTRDYIAEYLAKVEQQEGQLSAVDRRILREFLADYRMELTAEPYFLLEDEENESTYFLFQSLGQIKEGLSRTLDYRNSQEALHTFVYETDSEFIWIDWAEMLQYEAKNNAGRLLYHDGFRITGGFGDHFSGYMDLSRYVYQPKSEYVQPPHEFTGGWRYTGDDGANFHSFDYSHGYLQYSSVAGNFLLGTYPLYWGNGPNSMILSNSVPAFAHVGWNKLFLRAKYSFIHGSLLSIDTTAIDSTGEKLSTNKYLVGHRLELIPFSKLHITVSEMIIYGNRDIELAYLVPPVLLLSTEHNLVDRDNLLVALEFEYYPWDGLKFYGGLLLDELRLQDILKAHWANKQGVQIGTQLTPTIFGKPTEFTGEFTAVRPWTYTHKFAYNTYTHDSRGLGFSPGPNSQQWYVRNQWWLNERQTLSFEYRYLQHGIESLEPTDPGYYPIGSDPNQNYDERNEAFDASTEWLMGDIRKSQTFGISWNYQMSNVLTIDLGYRFATTESGTDHFTSFQIRFDY
ncbi:MAG: hypothetical protein MAGBODY4_00215 [Candidatus Marinimicrobia bacterium]|nr:hypothetical protein [Candidatus Neomarinimicrobiota bacterium]